MAVPKKKTSPSRRGMRRSADALKRPTCVEDKDSGRVVWEVIHEHEPGADVPDYSHPDIKFVVWSADSSAVTFPIGGGKSLTVPVR